MIAPHKANLVYLKEKTIMPKITKDSLPEDIIMAFAPEWFTGPQIEVMLYELRDARDGLGDSHDGEQIKLAMIHSALGRGIEAGVKDRHYEATIGVIGENRMVFDGVQFTTVAPGLPKTTKTDAHYVPNAAMMMDEFPPHAYPDLWTLVPASSSTTNGRMGYVACEVL